MNTPIILRQSFININDIKEVIDEYYTIKKKNYNNELSDELMIYLLAKYNRLGRGKEFIIKYIKNIYIPYVTIISYLTHQELIINFDRYKNDSIKKILSSEYEPNEIILKIENILFDEKL